MSSVNKLMHFPEKEFETIRILMCAALDESNKCECLSCRGLMVLAKRILEVNKN